MKFIWTKIVKTDFCDINEIRKNWFTLSDLHNKKNNLGSIFAPIAIKFLLRQYRFYIGQTIYSKWINF